jgi:hypothetical protein
MSIPSLRAEDGAKRRPKVKQSSGCNQELDCFIARALAMTNLKACFD